MSSEQLGSGENVLKGNLGGAWDIKHGYADAYTDLGVARRFGGAAAAYSLRDIGAMNGEVVRVRRVPNDTTTSIDDEANFSANQVSSGALEDWVNGKLEDTLPADVAQASAAYSLRKVSEGSLVYTYEGVALGSNGDILRNTTSITVSGNHDGIFGKDDVLKVENDAQGVPQIQLDENSGYLSSTSGVVEFEYYVPSTHPIVGNFWHIGTNQTSAGTEEVYTKDGVQIVGDAWTTVKLFYGSKYGGVDKPTTSSNGGQRLITILDQRVPDGVPVAVNGEDGDVYYINSLTIKTYNFDAVRIRRSSDNIEVNVAFDSDDKVSASSAITNVAEEGGEIMNTSATTLGDFISYRDNIIGNSEFNTAANLGFDDGSSACPLWTRAGSGAGSSTFTSNTTETTDPNGGNTAAKFQWSDSGTNWIRQETELAGGVEVTFSAYYKQLGSQTTVRHNYWKGNSDVNVVLDFSNGTISEAPSGGTAPTSSAVQNVGNGWYRVSMVLTTVAATTENKAQPARQPVGVTGGGVYVWGAMLEVGNTLGTYVKTTSEIPNGVAFVHTWYDQAGANNATQATAANQPQIATNGALLTDGLEFDSDFLQTSSQVLTGTHTGANSMYVVVKQTSADNGYICGSAGSGGAGSRVGQSLFSSNTNDLVVLTDGTDGATDGTLDNISRLEGVEYLISANYSNNNTDTLKKNANDSGYANGTNAYTFSAGSTFSIGTFGNSTVSGNLFAGSMKEIIVYDSNQTDNRFKIESNINNYYGLYDDANEVTGAFTASGQNSFTANGTDGFTIETATADAFAGIELKTKVSDNDIIYISFNADLLVSGTASPKVALRKTSISGTVSSDSPSSGEPSVQKGFNNIALVSSDDDAKFITFLEDANNVSYTISDFKVSRIQRIGLVQTWYDQSNNGNNATQSVANRQPPVVLNGGLCKMNNGNGAVMGVRDGTLFSGTQLEIDSAVTEPTTTFCTYYNQRSFIFLTAGTLTGSAPSIDLNTNGIEPRFTTADNMGNTTGLDNTIDGQLTVFSAVNGGTAVLRKDGLQLDTLTRTEAEVQGIGFIFRMQSNSGFSGIFVDALIIYDADKTSDFEEIEGELQRANNIVGV